MTSKWMDLAFKVLSILVIPLVIWGVKLEVGNAVQNEKIVSLEAKVVANGSLQNDLAALAVTQGRMEEKTDAIKERLDEIRSDLYRSLPPKP